jgi:hypothetical protein
MATERQIEANRRNARNSTGPRSGVGKKRASLNAYRRGLTKPIAGREFARQVEALARQILGDSKDKVKIDLAHDAAQAQIELERVRSVKVAFIKRLATFGRFDEPDHFASPKDEAAWILQHFCGASPCKKPPKLAGAPAHSGGSTPSAAGPDQTRPLRGPGHHAERPRHSRYLKRRLR